MQQSFDAQKKQTNQERTADSNIDQVRARLLKMIVQNEETRKPKPQ